MNLCFKLLIFLLVFISKNASAQHIGFHGKIDLAKHNGFDKISIPVIIKIIQKNTESTELYSENQTMKVDSAGSYFMMIGNGKNSEGKVDSIIWSDGSFFLQISSVENNTFEETIPLRIPTLINPENTEGIISDTDNKGFGKFSINKSPSRAPKKITFDLTTNYVNLDYPADTYPIYRHYEWFDTDGDGNGNSFMLTYSDKTTHEFWQNSKKIGDVKLYAIPFQEVIINDLKNNIDFEITKPEKVKNLSITYAIKSPFSLIYLIEW
jgi:hypothetical protein